MGRVRSGHLLLANNINIALGFVAALCAVELCNSLVPEIDFRMYGVRPRTLPGLIGIICAPFLHANLYHLVANCTALFVLSLIAFSFSRKIALFAILAIVLTSGLLLWVFGVHGYVYIGASGLIFGLLTFLVFIGLFRFERLALLISVCVLLLYGSALLTLLRCTRGVSWISYFSGAVSGMLAAWWTRTWQR